MAITEANHYEALSHITGITILPRKELDTTKFCFF